jgi:rod shape determining protein RodA
LVFRRIEKRFLLTFDWPMLFIAASICAFSLVVLKSAGFDPETQTSTAFEKQIIAMGLGFSMLILTALVNASFWHRVAWVIYSIGIVLLIAVDIKGVVAGGSQRWLNLGFIRMQPSEVMKVGVILVLARYFSSSTPPPEGYSFKGLIKPAMILMLPMLIVIAQPDLGTGMSIGLIGGSMLMLAGVNKWTILKVGLLGVLLAIPVWQFALKDYQRLRVVNFFHPESDPLGSGYHAIQSKIAVGSGAVTGKGFRRGTQTQLRFLPEQTTDFAFSVLAEEWGFMGSVALLFLYGTLVLRVIRNAGRAVDRFGMFVSFGVASLVFWHGFINIAMVIGVAPVVGITAPLLSYGGSSVVTILIGLGLALSVSMRRFVFA